MRALALVPLLFLSGCIFGGDEDKPAQGGIPLGLYEDKQNFLYEGVFFEAVDQMQFKAGGEYTGQGFLNTILVAEYKANYRVDGAHIIASNRVGRYLNDAGQMGPWTAEEGMKKTQVRNITATSFQIYWDPGPGAPPGLSAGWRAYNRIGS